MLCRKCILGGKIGMEEDAMIDDKQYMASEVKTLFDGPNVRKCKVEMIESLEEERVVAESTSSKILGDGGL